MGQGTSGWGPLCGPGVSGQRDLCGLGELWPGGLCRAGVPVPRGTPCAGGPQNRGCVGVVPLHWGGPSLGSARPSLAPAAPEARAHCPPHPALVPRVSRFSEASRAALPSPCCACCHGSVL